jgi:hypothetical protein
MILYHVEKCTEEKIIKEEGVAGGVVAIEGVAEVTIEEMPTSKMI